ncbi:hypothetical protein ACLB2K_025638 [Fragaria x ananassa]
MSTGVLDREGFHHHGGDQKWRLTRGSLVVARGKLCCTLYKTYDKICKGELNVTDDSSPSLWHKRLGHRRARSPLVEKGAEFAGVKVRELRWQRRCAEFASREGAQSPLAKEGAWTLLAEKAPRSGMRRRRRRGRGKKKVRQRDQKKKERQIEEEGEAEGSKEEGEAEGRRMRGKGKKKRAEGKRRRESVWTGRSASYSHLKVFGCKAFAHVPKQKRSKRDDKAVPCIFLGYGNEEMGYRLWNLITKKLFKSRDVVFHEDQIVANFDTNILENAERFTYDSSPL